MSNLKVGPAGQLYDPVTGAYVGHLDADGTEQMVLTATPSAQGAVNVTGGVEVSAGDNLKGAIFPGFGGSGGVTTVFVGDSLTGNGWLQTETSPLSLTNTMNYDGEGQLLRGREDADAGAMARIARFQHEHRLGQGELARDPLHPVVGDVVGIEHDRERVAFEARAREDVEGEEAVGHRAAPGRWARGR